MSEGLGAQYKQACSEQAKRIQARRIRNRIDDARAASSGAATRWPFELLQNIHDAGPRPGREGVNVEFIWDGTTFTLKHDGVPFKVDEVAALLAGGSSKEYDSDETTGRFGTGFMVTHVLAVRIELSLVIQGEEELELARVELDRSGDEAAILGSIEASEASIDQAERVDDFQTRPTASMQYAVDDPLAVEQGIAALRRTLPYLFATCPKLGTVVVNTPGQGETWTREPEEHPQVEGALASRWRVTARGANGTLLQDLGVWSVRSSQQSRGALVVATQNTDAQPSFVVPKPDFPKLFARFPVGDTTALPLPCTLNAPFGVPQERNQIHMNESDKELIVEALSALPALAREAAIGEWNNGHRLAHVGPVPVPDSEYRPIAEWWNSTLANVANELATVALIRTERGLLPAVVPEDSNDSFADFVVPRFSKGDHDGPSLEHLWPVITGVTDARPPVQPLAEAWTRIALSWQSLGVEVSVLALDDVVELAKGDDARLGSLVVQGDPFLWIARLIDVVGCWWVEHQSLHPALLKDLLPDQRDNLRSPEALAIDAELAPELKDRVEAIGLNIRSRLLNRGLLEAAQQASLRHFAQGLEKLITSRIDTDLLLTEATSYLEKHVADAPKAGEREQSLLLGCRDLISHLWSAQGKAAAETVRRLPLLTRAGSIVRGTKGSLLMGPANAWPESAQPFVDAYASNRVLHDLYAGSENRDSLVPALTEWGLIAPEPLSTERPAELARDRLEAVAEDGADVKDVTVSGSEFSQVVHLASELIPRAAADPSVARSVLGLILCHVARTDPRWSGWQDVKGRRAGVDVPLKVRTALWIGDLKYRGWLPFSAEGGKAIAVPASAAALKPLLEPSWLVDNEPAMSLLVDVFGLNPLELRITASTANPEDRAKVESALATIVQQVGADPEAYVRIADEIATRKKQEQDVNRNRSLGLAIQAVIEQSLKARGLLLELIDHGYDYDVSLPDLDLLHDGSHRIGVGQWMLEVKATTSGDVRMTPAQATRASAEPDRYLLCVVDLRGLAPEQMTDDAWTPELIEPRARLFTTIGASIAPTCDLVEEAVESPVGIRNERVLRYAVPSDLWSKGDLLREWVAALGLSSRDRPAAFDSTPKLEQTES